MTRKLGIFGSCITRDNFNSRFNPEHRRWYDVAAQANQSSIIALMSPPIEPELTEQDGLTAYDDWNVRSDLSRAFLTDVVEAQPDFLLLDFFGDMFFGVLGLPDGRFVTNNRWKLHKTAQYASMVAGGGTYVLTPGQDPERYFDLWTQALDRFADFVMQHCPNTTVVVHRGFFADKVVTGATDQPSDLREHARLGKLEVEQLNAFWCRIDDYAVTTHGWAQIDLRAEHYTSVSNHPWGPFWVHYTLDYYPRFLAELHLLGLTRDLPAEIAGQVERVGDTYRSHLRRQAASTRRATEAKLERLASLNGVGGMRAVARAALTGLRSTQGSHPEKQQQLPDESLIPELASKLSAEQADQLRAVETASRDRATAEATRWAAVHEDLDTRIRELQGGGRARAVASGVGQRIRRLGDRKAAR